MPSGEVVEPLCGSGVPWALSMMLREDDDESRAWHEPGVYAVASDVFRIPLLLPDAGLRAVNVYAVRDGEDVVLIDSGQALDASRRALERALEVIGFGLHHVREFFVTHIHRDHYTQAVALRREFGSRIRLGLVEQPSFAAVADPTCDRFVSQLLLLRMAGAPALAGQMAGTDDGVPPDLWEHPDEWLEGGSIQLSDRIIEAQHTPGHTRGHLVFRDDEAGICFTGDHVLPHITPSIGFEPAVTPLPLADFLQSLEAVRRLPDLRLLPAHGAVGRSVHARIDELLEHHAQRLEASRLSVERESTAADVARELRWTRRLRRLDELSLFDQMLAVLETKAHLDVLVAVGRVRVEDEDGVHVYTKS